MSNTTYASWTARDIGEMRESMAQLEENTGSVRQRIQVIADRAADAGYPECSDDTPPVLIPATAPKPPHRPDGGRG